MSSNLDDVAVRLTIKSLHKKFSQLFYLENTEGLSFLSEINELISESSEYGISQCIDIIIPPIIMAIHKYLKNESCFKPSEEDSEKMNKKSEINSLNITYIEELFKILHNVLCRVHSSDLVSTRISMIFFDILFPIIQAIRIFKIEKSEFFVDLLIKITKKNFILFWKYWKYDISDPKGQYLIIPVIVDFFISISLPLPIGSRINQKIPIFSKNIKEVSLELLSEIPKIVNNNEILIKIFPGVIQAVGLQIININIESTPFEIITLSLKTFIEWFSYCIGDINMKSISSNDVIVSTVNTGKIIEHILIFKSHDLSLYRSFITTGHSGEKSGKITIIRELFVKVAKSCLVNSFNNFNSHSKETLKRCIDFLFSMLLNTESDIIVELNDFLSEFFCCCDSDKKTIFLKEYFLEVYAHFEYGVFTKIRNESDNTILLELQRLISRDLGILFFRDKFKVEQNRLNLENILNSFFENFLSDSSIEIYQDYILNFSHVFNKSNKNKLPVSSNEYSSIEIFDISMEVANVIFFGEEPESEDVLDCEFDVFDDVCVFQLFGDIVTSVICTNFKGYDVEKLRSFSLLAMDIISVSIANQKGETISDSITSSLKWIYSRIYSNDLKCNLFIDFLTFFIICHLTELLLKDILKYREKNCYFIDKTDKQISQLLLNLFEFSIENFLKNDFFYKKSIGSAININILLILMGNIINMVNNIGESKESYTRKFSSIVYGLFYCLCSRQNTIHKSAKYVLIQFSILLKTSNFSNFSIKKLLVDYSVDILRSLETMFYTYISHEKIELFLLLLQNCRAETLVELDDLVDKVTKIDINNNTWVFEFILTISHRLSFKLFSFKKKLISKLLSDHMYQFVKLKKEININFRSEKENIRKLLFIFCLESNTFFNNITEKVYYMICDNDCGDLFTQHFEGNLSKRESNYLNVDISKIRLLIKKLMPISYSFSFNNNKSELSIPRYQNMSVNALLNCIYILSTHRRDLLPEANRIVSHATDSWKRAINSFTNKKGSKCNNTVLNIREISIINQILIKLIVSCGNFIINKLEEGLIPLLLKFIEFIFEKFKICEFMDDKEEKSNSTIYKISIQALNLLKYFTKYYSIKIENELKLETLNNIVGRFISPIIGNYSIYWKLVSTEIIVTVFRVFPFLIKTHLKTIKDEIHNDHTSNISFIVRYLSRSYSLHKRTRLSGVSCFITNTESESSLISRMNSI